MPIDPNIANPKMFQMPDPMDSMGKVLTNAMLVEKMQSARDTNRRNAMMRTALKGAYDDKGNLDRNKARYNLAQSDAADAIPEMEKGWWEADKATADAAGTKAETLKKQLESFRTVLAPHVNNPKVTAQDLYGVMTAAFNDPVIGEWYGQMGVTPEKMKQGIDHAAQQGQLSAMARVLGLGADKALENTTMHFNTGEGVKVMQGQKYGTGVPTEVKSYKSPAGASTTINIGGGDDYAKELAKLRAKDDFDKGKRAEAAPLILDDIRRGLSLVDRAYTGYLSEGQGALNSMGNAVGVNTNEDARVATQELKMILSGDMLKNIGTLRNEYDVKLGSVTEKEFAQLQSTVPKMTDDPKTIKAWFRRLDGTARKAQQEYQQRLGDISTNPVTAPAVQGMSVPPPPQLPPTALPKVKTKRGTEVAPDAIRDLLNGSGTDAEFDAAFGEPGLAKRVRAATGGAPNGGRPFAGEAGAR